KGEKAILVSDANHFEGSAPGKYIKRNNHEVILQPDGKLYMANSPDILSGAALALHKGVENVIKFGIASLGEAINMASLHPAQMLGLACKGVGTLNTKAPADFFLFQMNENFDLNILETMLEGHCVFLAKESGSN